MAALVAASGLAHAADAPLSDQQKRMQVCNAEAKTKSFKDKDERSAFMSGCLKGETGSGGDKLTTQQERMKSCNAQAKAKTFKDADERRTFMSACLKG
jgi:hypothetical protein